MAGGGAAQLEQAGVTAGSGRAGGGLSPAYPRGGGFLRRAGDQAVRVVGDCGVGVERVNNTDVHALMGQVPFGGGDFHPQTRQRLPPRPPGSIRLKTKVVPRWAEAEAELPGHWLVAEITHA